MQSRAGVILLLFDLPNETAKERRDYAAFRKHIIKRGYVMIQKSVYVKYLRNIASSESELAELDVFAPSAGGVAAIPLNVSNFSKFRSLRGCGFDLDSFISEIVTI